MFEKWKRRRFKKKVLATVAKLDRSRREAICKLPDNIIIEGLECGYQHTEYKVNHTIDILLISAWLHTYHRTG